jgi:hypothetical protein
MSINTKRAPVNETLDKKTKISLLLDHHRPMLNKMGITNPNYCPKMAYMDRGERVVSFFPSEIERGEDIYTEFVSRDYDSEDETRTLYKWKYNPHYASEYRVTEPHSANHTIRYIIPVAELFAVEQEDSFDDFESRKKWWFDLKPKKTFESYLFFNIVYRFRIKVCPTFERMKKKGYYKFSNYPVYDFFKNANITFSNSDGLSIYEEYKQKADALILLDPPYLLSDNSLYFTASGVEIYQYLSENNFNKEPAKIYMIVESTWITKLLFKKDQIHEYAKKYQLTKKNTYHSIFSNVKI